MAKVKRSLFKSFLNTGTLVSPTWSLIGDGVTTATINYNPQTVEETYIVDDSASIFVDSYAPNFPVEMTAISGDDVFDFIDALRKGRSVLSAAEGEIVNVWLYRTPALGYYLAEKQAVSIQVDDFGGDGGQATKLNYTINFVGDPVKGYFNPSTLDWVPAPVNTILSTMVIGSVTLTPLFASDKSWLFYAGSVPTETTTVTMTSTLTGATIVQKDEGVTVNQGANASLDVGVNHLTIEVTVGDETSIYHIDITRAAA